MATDQVINDNPVLRILAGGIEIAGGVGSGGVLGGFLVFDGGVRIISGIDELGSKKKPKIMNGGSIFDQLIPGDGTHIETAVDVGSAFSSAVSGDPYSAFMSAYDLSH